MEHNSDNLFKTAIGPALWDELRSRFGDNAPTLTTGWADEVHKRYGEVIAEPIILDSFAYAKAFGSRDRLRRPCACTDPASFSLAVDGATRSGLPLDVVTKFIHYAKGLISMYDLGTKLNVPKTILANEPLGMLGYKFVNHQGALEFGLTLTEERPFSEKVVEAAKLLLRRRTDDAIASGTDFRRAGLDLDDYLNVVASYPRGKNTGLPWMASGVDRFSSDVVLAIDAALASCLVRGYPVDKMFDGLLLGYVVFSRFQRTAKPVPLEIGSTKLSSKGIEARRRIINSTPKIISLALKPMVAFTTFMHLAMPEFDQERASLSKRVRGAAFVRATDASRFDLRSGGVKLKQGLEVFVDTIRHVFPSIPAHLTDLLFTEAFLPTMVTVDTNMGPQAHWSEKSALRSGASTTSRAGSIINLMYDMTVYEAMHPEWSSEDIVSYYIRHEPSVIQGDDMLKLFTSREEHDEYMAALPSLDRVGMVVEPESPAKFLGYLTQPLGSVEDPTAASGLYHSSNPLANMFFPERFRTYAVASMLSRYVILVLKEASAVTRELTAIARDPNLAMRWYKRFYANIYPALAPHYTTHPVGAARSYFATLPHPNEVTTLELARMIKHDEDELLRHIAHSTRFDVNVRLFGETGGVAVAGDADDVTDSDDEATVTASLAQLTEKVRTTVAGRGPGGATGDAAWLKKLSRPHVRALLSLFNEAVSDEVFVARWRSLLGQTSRRVDTPFGPFYTLTL